MMFNCQQEYPDIVLNGKSLNWQNKVKHVGNVINSSLTYDIILKKQDFFHQVNKLIADYKGVCYDVLRELFAKKCNSFYGSQMWDLRTKHVESLIKAWNRAARRILELPYDSHRFLLPELLNMKPLHVQLCKRVLTMYSTMYNSDNKTISYLYKHCLHDKNSFIARNVFYINLVNTINVKGLKYVI